MPAGTASRWWYGVASLPVLAILLYLFVFALVATRDVDTSDPALVVNVLGTFGAAFVGFLILLLTVLFSVSLVMDVRAVRRSESDWSPSWAYGLVAVVHLLNLVFPVLWLVVTVPGAALYLYRRHRHLGVP